MSAHRRPPTLTIAPYGVDRLGVAASAAVGYTYPATTPRYPYPTEWDECYRCHGEGEVEDDLWVITRCYTCGGGGFIEVCAECGDNGEECDACGN